MYYFTVTHQTFFKTSGHFEANLKAVLVKKIDNSDFRIWSNSTDSEESPPFLIEMSKTVTTPREKSKLATKTVTPQQANISLASISRDEEADDGLFVDVDSLQVST